MCHFYHTFLSMRPKKCQQAIIMMKNHKPYQTLMATGLFQYLSVFLILPLLKKKTQKTYRPHYLLYTKSIEVWAFYSCPDQQFCDFCSQMLPLVWENIFLTAFIRCIYSGSMCNQYYRIISESRNRRTAILQSIIIQSSNKMNGKLYCCSLFS